MKRALLLGTALVSMSSGAFAADLIVDSETPAMATSSGSYAGFVELSANASSYEYWGDDYNPWLGFGGAAALAYQLDDNMSVGVELRTWTALSEPYDGEYSAYGTLGAGHVNWTDGYYSFGAFGGVISHNDYYSTGTDIDLLGGVEGDIALSDAVTISGQAGYIHQISGYYPMGGVGFAAATVAFFPADNIKLSATLGGIMGQVGDDSDETAATLTYSLEAAYQFDDSPISVFARFSGYQDNDYWNDQDGGSGQTISVGARFAFDGQSLKDQSKSVHQVTDLSALSWLRLDAW